MTGVTQVGMGPATDWRIGIMCFRRTRFLLLRLITCSVVHRPSAERANVLPGEIAAVLAHLPVRTRTVFLLHARDDLTYAEIAEGLGCSLAEVEYQLAEALRALDLQIGDISATPAVAPGNERG